MEATDWAANLANLPEEQRGPLFGLPVPLDDDDDGDDGDDDDDDDDDGESVFPSLILCAKVCPCGKVKVASCINIAKEQMKTTNDQWELVSVVKDPGILLSFQILYEGSLEKMVSHLVISWLHQKVKN